MSALPKRRAMHCRCRICIAKSLARAVRHLDLGRHLVAADIVICAVFDLTHDAVFIPTGRGKAEPLCEGCPDDR